MKLFVITYDLRNQKDYQKLYDELNRLNAKPILASTWGVKLSDSNTPVMVRDHFAKFIDFDDAIMVSEVCNWAARNIKSDPNKY